jgi:hypothetical protein
MKKNLTKFVLPSLIAFLLLFPGSGQGALVDIGKIAVGAVNTILGLAFWTVLQILILFSGALTMLAFYFFDWIFNLGIHYTGLNISCNFDAILKHPDPSVFVNLGWCTMRDLANIFFALIFVFIGLCTALGIKEYEAKKTLPKLIIAVLLINFSRVLVGIVVDFSNLIMNFFVGDLSGLKIFAQHLSAFAKNFFYSIEGEAITQPTFLFGLLAQGLTIVFFNLISAFLLWCYGILFLLRYAIIWLLTILAPLAFAAWVLPATAGIWRRWLRNLLSWSFIGVTVGVFLWLSLTLLYFVLKGKEYLSYSYQVEGFSTKLIATLLPYGVVIIFLILGLLAGPPSGAEGARYAMGYAKKGLVLGKRYGWGALRGLRPIRKAEAGVRKTLERLPLVGRMVGGVGAFEAEQARERSKAKERLSSFSSKALQERIAQPAFSLADRIAKAAALEILAERGDLKDPQRRWVREAELYGVKISDILTRRPDWAPEIGESIADRVRLIPANQARRIQLEALENLEVAGALDPYQLADLRRAGTLAQREKIWEHYQKSPDSFLKASHDYLFREGQAENWP